MLRRTIIFFAFVAFASSVPLIAQNDIVEAIKADNITVVRQKIGSGAGQLPLNGKDGIVPLLLGVQNNALQTTRWLLEQGADKEIKTRGGSTPLSLAAYMGHADIVDALIKASATLGTKSPNGYQPLDWALENNHPQIIAKLFYAWGLKEAVDASEKEILHEVNAGNYIPIPYRKEFTSFPLALAIAKKSPPLVQKLLLSGFDPNKQNAAGYAPLPLAARLGDTSIMRHLLVAGANPNIGGTKGNDVAGALNQAARGLNVAAGKLLIQCGANVNKGNAIGITPLYICGRSDTKDGAFTEMLLNNKAALRQKADDGYDAFDAAMESRNRLFTQIVLKELFIRSIPQSQNKQVFLEALSGKTTNIPSLSDESAILLMNYAVVKGDSMLFTALLARSTNLKAQNSSGHYPLTLAASWGEKNMLKQMLERGADVNIQNENRYHTSALMESTRDGNYDIAEELLKRKATVNLNDVHNDHALNWATFFGRKDIVQLLLANGADFTQMGQQTNDNAMDIALRMNFQEIAQILKTAGARASK